jgi:hypothetical protein
VTLVVEEVEEVGKERAAVTGRVGGPAAFPMAADVGGEDGVGCGEALGGADLPPAFRRGHEPVKEEERRAAAFRQVADGGAVGAVKVLAVASWARLDAGRHRPQTKTAPRGRAGRFPRSCNWLSAAAERRR